MRILKLRRSCHMKMKYFHAIVAKFPAFCWRLQHVKLASSSQANLEKSPAF